MTRRAALIARLRDERGVTAPIVAICLVVILGVAALATDLGYAYLQKRRLQNAVDFALLAGAQKLPNSTNATADAQTFLNSNWQQNAHTGSNPTVNSIGTCSFDPSNPKTQCATGAAACNGTGTPCQIHLKATASVPTFFGKIFGVGNINVSAQGSACGGCDSTVQKYDVVVVLDRSYSMCLDDNEAYNNCYDLNQAKQGIQALLNFFNPATDRLGLAVLSSGDNVAPFNHTGTYPCDSANVNDASGHGPFYGSVGDFMDGTPSSHDSWLIAPLSNTFKNADGTINTSSQFVSDLNCLQPKFWTPMAPAVQAATNELINNGRPDAHKIIIYMGDGGGNAQPMKRDANGNATTTPSWYTPSPGNNLLPCRDAVGQAAIAKAHGIDVYTIGYDINSSQASTCYANNQPLNNNDIERNIDGLDANTTLLDMATDASHFYQKQTPGEVYSIFNAIGHQITSSGTRLTS
jgi:Flp pilus assembly protein TadG